MSKDYPTIVIIKRNGADGSRFPLCRKECLFGRNADCDLRVQLPGVAMEHAKICQFEEGNEFYLESLANNETKINGKLVKERIELRNMDVFSIAERSFRFECGLIEGKFKGKSPVKGVSQSPKKVAVSPKVVSQSGKRSPLQEANHSVIKDSPRTPRPRHNSLRKSLGELRRKSIPFKEVEETDVNWPADYETKENHQVCVAHSVSSPKRFAPANTPKSTRKKSKRVSFGPMLSPEQFDKNLPVATPVKKGGTPRRLSAPLAKPCISPARRRYSLATPLLGSKIEEEKEESDEESDQCGQEFGTPSGSLVAPGAESSTPKRKKLATPLRNEIERGKKLRGRNKKMSTPLKSAIKQGFRLKASKKKMHTPLKKEIQAGVKLRQTRKKLVTPVRKAIQNKPILRATKKRMSTPIRHEIESKPSLRQTKRVMAKELQNEIAKGKTLRKTMKVMAKELQEDIKAGRQLKNIKRTMNTELQKEIIEGKELRKTKRRMPTMLQDEIKSGAVELNKTKKTLKTPLRKEIKAGVSLRKTKRRMATMLQDEIKSGAVELNKTKKTLKTPLRKEIKAGVSLRKTKRRMPTMLQDEIKSGAVELNKTKKTLKTPLRKEIKAGVSLRKTKRRMPKMLQDEIKSGVSLKKTKKRMPAMLQDEIKSGVSLRKTKRRMPTMLQDEIKSGAVELNKTKKTLKTPLRKEIKAGVGLRKTKRRMPTMLQDEIKSGAVELNKTKKTLKTPLRKEIKAGVSLRKTKRRLPTMLQDEIKSAAVELNKTKKSLKTPLRKEIEGGVNLRKTKRRMRTMLQDEIKSGAVELNKTKKTLKTPLRKEIKAGVNLRKTKRRMPTMLQDEIKSGQTELTKTKKSLKTPLRKQIESGIRLRETKSKEPPNAITTQSCKTPKRRHSNVNDDDECPHRSSKKLKTPNKTPRQSGFFPSSKSRRRSVSRRKSVKKPSYAEILKRPKLTAKRRLTGKQKKVFEFQAEVQQATKESKRITTAKTMATTKAEEPKVMSSKRKSLRSEKADTKKSEWKVVVNQRKIKRIKRKRAAKSQEEADLSGLTGLFKTPKLTGAQAKKAETPKEATPKRKVPERAAKAKKQPDDSLLFGVSRLMKTPKVREEREENYEGIAELFEVLEMASPIEATATPSLRKATEIRTVVAPPQVVTSTPSLRRKESTVEVAAPLQPENTPGLRRASDNAVVNAPLQVSSTPSLKKPAGNVTMASPLIERKTPSLKTPVKEALVRSPQQIPSNTEAKIDIIVVEPTQDPAITTAVVRSTRSKRKLEEHSVPAPKRPRRAKAQESTKEQTQPIKADPIPKKTQVKNAEHDISENTDTSRSGKKTEKNKEPNKNDATKRTSRTRSRGRVDIGMDQEPVDSSKPARKGRTPRNVRQQKGEVEAKPRETEATIEDFEDEALGELALVVKKPRTRRSHRNAVAQPEQLKVDVSDQRSTRSSRNKKEQVKPPMATKPSVAPTPKISTRGRKGKNVAGIPETPEPFQFSKTKLEPIIEVPTPASSLRGSVVKLAPVVSTKVAEQASGCQRTSRTRPKITTVIEETAEESGPPPKRRKNVQVGDIENEVETVAVVTKGSRSHRKKEIEASTEEESSGVNPKRLSRRTRATASKEAKVVGMMSGPENVVTVTKDLGSRRSKRTKEPSEEMSSSAVCLERLSRRTGGKGKVVAEAKKDEPLSRACSGKENDKTTSNKAPSENIIAKRLTRRTKVTENVQEEKTGEGRQSLQTARGRRNKASEENETEGNKVSDNSVQTRKRKVTMVVRKEVVVIEKPSDNVRETRTTKRLEKIVENQSVSGSSKRPRRGVSAEKGEKETVEKSSEGKRVTKSKRTTESPKTKRVTTRSAARDTTEKDKQGSNTTKKKEKPVSPVARVTRSKRVVK